MQEDGRPSWRWMQRWCCASLCCVLLRDIRLLWSGVQLRGKLLGTGEKHVIRLMSFVATARMSSVGMSPVPMALHHGFCMTCNLCVGVIVQWKHHAGTSGAMLCCIPRRWWVGNVECRPRGRSLSALEHLRIEIQVPSNPRWCVNIFLIYWLKMWCYFRIDACNIQIVCREMSMFGSEDSSSKVAEFLVANNVDWIAPNMSRQAFL